MRIHSLSARDKSLFNKYLHLKEHELSAYAFENIYIWRNLFKIKWQVIEGCLCVFFQDKFRSFLYLPALGEAPAAKTITRVFEIMDRVNKNKEVSRVENIEERDVDFYRGMGLDCLIKSHDYLCLRQDLADLAGNKFKSKRAPFNYFVKHYDFEYLVFSARHTKECIGLYKLWMQQRQASSKDKLYQWMLEDGLNSLTTMLDGFRYLNLTGRIVKINGKTKAFTFGFKLNTETFCILYEITDLTIKGLAQFIFKSFCQEQKGFTYINVMDDSCLENLKRVKLSYRPVRLVASYTARRKDE